MHVLRWSLRGQSRAPGETRLHFLGQPGQVILGEPALERAEGEARQSEVKLGPLVKRRVLDLDGDFLACLADGCAMHLCETRRADRTLVELREEVGQLAARVFAHHFLDRFERRDGALVLQRDEGVAPLVGQEVVHAAEVLAQLDEDGAVALQRAEGPFRAAQVACFKLVLVVGVGVVPERVAVAVAASVRVDIQHVTRSYSLMFNASVVATLDVLCAAAHACFASSLTVTTVAPSAIPAPSTSNRRLLLLFLATGHVAASTLLANEFRCCRSVWRCDWRHVRHVHGTVPLRRARSELPRRMGERWEADMTDFTQSWYFVGYVCRLNATKRKTVVQAKGLN